MASRGSATGLETNCGAEKRSGGDLDADAPEAQRTRRDGGAHVASETAAGAGGHGLVAAPELDEARPIDSSGSNYLCVEGAPKLIGDDGDGHRYGNFKAYYDFNPARERLRHVPADFALQVIGKEEACSMLTIWDVGCNAGELSVGLADLVAGQLRDKVPVKLLGTDLDPALVHRAQSLCVARDGDSTDAAVETCFLVANAMDPGSCSLGRTKLAEWRAPRALFDLVCLWSITMWIHLNHGDAGLKLFVKNVASVARCVLVEPQPWKCYKSARKRQRIRGMTPFKDIEIKGKGAAAHAIDETLRREGFGSPVRLGETAWSRDVLLYRRTSAS